MVRLTLLKVHTNNTTCIASSYASLMSVSAVGTDTSTSFLFSPLPALTTPRSVLTLLSPFVKFNNFVQALFVARRPERVSDMVKRIKNPTWRTRCILFICCISIPQDTNDTQVTNNAQGTNGTQNTRDHRQSCNAGTFVAGTCFRQSVMVEFYVVLKTDLLPVQVSADASIHHIFDSLKSRSEVARRIFGGTLYDQYEYYILKNPVPLPRRITNSNSAATVQTCLDKTRWEAVSTLDTLDVLVPTLAARHVYVVIQPRSGEPRPSGYLLII
ncbi:hypothetical protein AZE42_13024 [Rhizopogon vesiculosus]|uniref:Uncharacterized protein n=1 Tax=Rhizopogon vesiculosus TaxID=180088 RepID=A0A1J8QT14_9AGAM|nr:hypothetical protein AZE42_13024 [Rhizopogon vesiculosus]